MRKVSSQIPTFPEHGKHNITLYDHGFYSRNISDLCPLIPLKYISLFWVQDIEFGRNTEEEKQ